MVDAFVLAPCIALYFWVLSLDGTAPLLAFPVIVICTAYPVWFHARTGQTLGKRLASIRVVKLTGERISWKEAALRSSVDLALGLTRAMATVLALYQLSDVALNVGWLARSELLIEQGPAWGRYAQRASNAWYWSELVFLLFNAKRRALHDFIAGTVVVVESVQVAAHEQPSIDSA